MSQIKRETGSQAIHRLTLLACCLVASVNSSIIVPRASGQDVEPAAQTASQSNGTGQPSPEEPAVAAIDGDQLRRVLARVGDDPITVADVLWQLGHSPSSSDFRVPPEEVINNSLHLIAIQRQALATLREMGLAPTRPQVDAWIVENQSLPAAPQSSDDDTPNAETWVGAISQAAGIRSRSYRQWVAFRMAWPKYLERHLNEENLQRFYQRHRSRFDGTQFRVELASRVVPVGHSSARQSAHKQLEQLRRRLTENDGQSTDEPTSRMASLRETESLDSLEIWGPDWVSGAGDLDPSLMNVVSRLQAGEVSPPIDSATGVHLVRLLAIRPGDKQLDQVRDAVRTHMLIYLLDYLAERSADELPLEAAGKLRAVSSELRVGRPMMNCHRR